MPLQDLIFTEDMSPAERATLMKYGPEMLSASRAAVRMGGGPAALLMTQRPNPGGATGKLDALLNLMGLVGTPLGRAGVRAR